MKKTILLLLLPCLIGVSLLLLKSPPTLEEIISIEQEKSFVFLLYSNDPPKTCEQNIISLLEQEYNNYRIVFMETENVRSFTPTLKTICAKENKAHLLTIISFKEEQPNAFCFQKAISLLKDDEIVVQIECNDWLANNLILHRLNHLYSSSDETWLTYSQYLEYPSYQKGNVDPYMKRTLRTRYNRQFPWTSSHLKIYYAQIFKQISPKEPDLDLYFTPLAEYSKNHIRFIEEVLYIHNTE